MTTPQWTVDEYGDLSFRHEGVDWWLRFEALYRAWSPFGDPEHAVTAHAALVADVAAARLVDDMAAVVRAAEAVIEWWDDDTRGGATEPEALRRALAVLHHARQQ